MTTTKTSLAGLLLLTGAAGCGDPGSDPARSDASPRFGVVRTDYQSTAIALVDASGEIVDPALLSSASAAPGLVAPLSGDVVLATPERFGAGVLYVLDRFGTDVITRVGVDTGAVLGQLRVAPGSGSFSSNPHDLALVSEGRGFVSRFGVSIDPGAAPLDRGNDLLELDLERLEPTGRRVGFEALTESATVDTDEGPRAVEVFARPSGLAFVDGAIVVGLARLAFDFDAGLGGQVALVDPESLELSVLDLPDEVRNCGALEAVPGRTDRVLVGCSGFARPFGDPVQVRASSGVFELELSAAGLRIVRSWTPREASRPLAVNALSPVDSDRFFAVAQGALGEGGDTGWLIDLRTGEAERVLESAEAFALGRPARLPSGAILLVPDRAREGGGLRRVRLDAGSAARELPPVRFGDPLPPSSVHALQ